MIKLYISFLISILFVSCTHKAEENLSKPLVLKNGLLYSDSLSTVPFTGRNKSNMFDMKIEYDVVNGEKEGDFITYYSNDKVQISGKMKANKNVGEWKYYFPDGSLETSGFFDNDSASGKWVWYNQKGQILEEGSFLAGLRDGEWKTYDSTGVVSIIRIYKNNEVIDSTKVN